ncbi:unnamed protein product [Prorocentrum cordatum]|uniref:HMA domain-containing protein n=1 Tax=Prorocentrum cordatum TaxID=2364126 RepID=A0ABN9PRT0_9DINO|nr:unnamed protein product [Polarella glacialis]
MGMSLGPMGLSLALQSVELQTHLTVTLVVEGMTGPDCVEKVTKALIAIEGVVCVDVSLDLEEVDVVYQPFVLRRDLRDAVRRAGYTAGVQMNGAMSHTHTDPSSTRRSPSLSNVRSPDRDSLQPLGFGTMPGAAATDRSISDPTASRGSSLN